MLMLLILVARLSAQTSDAARPKNLVNVTFRAAPEIDFPNSTDSNSPAVWIDQTFYVFNSFAGEPRRALGPSLSEAQDPDPDEDSSTYTSGSGGRWLEAIVPDPEEGRLYAWYHNEIPVNCPQGLRLWPRIGAAVSSDNGESWDDLGIVLEPRPGTVSCETEHPVTNGGIGDFSVVLDQNGDPATHYVYFIFSSYGGALEEQGISFARMLWSDRDEPLDSFSGESAALKWDGTGWTSPGIGGYSQAVFHDTQQVTWGSAENNGYWGPSVHWNWDLHKFIVLMNRSTGGNYESGGIYMTYTTALDDPLSWAAPKLIVSGNNGWYPQVIGIAAGRGSDREAGATARYFIQGKSGSLITFAASSTQVPNARAR